MTYGKNEWMRVKLQAEKDARIKEAAELRVLIDQRTEEMCSLRAQMDDLESKNAELSGGLKESFSSTFDEMNDASPKGTTSRDSYASQLDELTKEYEDLKRSTSQRESKLLDTIDQTNSMMDEQAADLKKRCATWEHEFAVSKETNCELQLCVRKKDEDLLEAQKQLSRLQVEFLGTSQAQATRIEELTSCCGVIEAERDTLQDELRKERERHQAELESIQGNHQLEKARLVIRVRDLEAMEVAKKDQVLRDLEASEAKKDQVLRDLEASEAKMTKADKKTKALLASVQKEAEDLRGQVGTLSSAVGELVDPVKEERVEVALLMTPVATKKGRCGRKRKASPPVKPAADSVPQEESPVKRPRSRRKFTTTALQQQDEKYVNCLLLLKSHNRPQHTAR
eukprot:Em0013g819a